VSDTLINVSVVVCAAHLTAAQKTSQAFVAQTVQAHPELWQHFARAICSKGRLTTEPMAQRTPCPQQDGIMFIEDAAGFFALFIG
jgi:flavin-dependent dehydrogenase